MTAWKSKKMQALSSPGVKPCSCFLLYEERDPVASSGSMRGAAFTLAPRDPDLWYRHQTVTAKWSVTGL